MPTGTTLGGREEDQGRILLFGDPVVQVELRKFFEHRRMIGRKAVIEKILAHLDAKAPEPEATRRPPCRAPPQRGLFGETG